jgi:hypothetical protein
VARNKTFAGRLIPDIQRGSMPALFAYILSLAVFIGGGYAGLVWLSEPAPTETHASLAKPSSVKPSSVKSATAAPSAAGPIAPELQIPESKPAESPLPEQTRAANATIALQPAAGEANKPAVAMAANSPTKDVPATDSPAKIDDQRVVGTARDAAAAETDGIPPGGCTPIGLTAQGEIVFPMQCRALLEQHRGPVASTQPSPAAAVPAAAAPAQTGLPPQTTTAESKAAADAEPTGSAKSEADDQSRPTPAVAKPAPARIAKLDPSEQRADSGLASHAQEKADSPNSVKPRKQRQSARSRPVMMILRTIEFPDGHREQRLLPMSHSRTVAAQSDD